MLRCSPSLYAPVGCRDTQRGFQLYQSDPSGNYGGWKATAIGANHQAATNVLQGDFTEELSTEEVSARCQSGTSHTKRGSVQCDDRFPALCVCLP